MLITKTSTLTGKSNTMDLNVTSEQLEDWKINKKLIQRAMPHLNADEREFLISGTTPEEWDQHFPEQ